MSYGRLVNYIKTEMQSMYSFIKLLPNIRKYTIFLALFSAIFLLCLSILLWCSPIANIGQCAKCANFEQKIYFFERQMKAANMEEQSAILASLRFDPMQKEMCHYGYGVYTLQKNNKEETYIVELTFHCFCHHLMCFRKNEDEISITLEIKGERNYYSLFYE